jgi:hypothetical protein
MSDRQCHCGAWPHHADCPSSRPMEGVTRGELLVALRQSVSLQSHYAGLLNQYDEGERIVFPDAEAWIRRLRALGKLPP